MKKVFFAFISSILLICFSSCEDTSDIGLSIIPPNDGITVSIDTFNLNSSTYIVPSVFANSTVYLLGEYDDSKYGHTKGGILAQVMFPQENLTFPTGAIADSMNLDVSFSSIVQNEGAVFDIYQMKKTLVYREKYYTNINVDEYVDFGTKLGSISLSVQDIADADTLISDQNSANFSVKLGPEFAERFMDESIYRDRDTFLEFFKGIYLVPANGSGKTVIYVDSIDLRLTYHYQEEGTTVYKTLDYPANNEVRQINSISHTGLEAILSSKSDTLEYIYSPAGFFTEVDIPVKSIIERTAKNGKTIALNTVKFSVKIEEADDDGLSMPSYLLLVSKDSVDTFFETKSIPKGTSSFYARLNSDNTYTFDITYYAQRQINMYDSDHPDNTIDIAKMVLVPIKATFSSSSSSSSMTAAEPMPYLSGVTLSNKNATKNPLRLTVAYSEFFKKE